MNPVPRVGLGVLVINQENQILLGKRLGSHGEGFWAPPGGHLEFNETPQEGAIRELIEETSLVAKSVLCGPWVNDFYPEHNKQYVSLFMLVSDYEGTVVNNEPDKCESWQWIDVDQLPSPLFKPLSNLVKQYDLGKLISKIIDQKEPVQVS